MAVLAVIRFKGDPDGLVEGYEKIVASDQEQGRTIAEGDGYSGRISSHVCARTDEGIIMVDVLPSREAFDAEMNDPLFTEAFASSGLPAPEVQLYDIHRIDTKSA
jgi:hypothetical protein